MPATWRAAVAAGEAVHRSELRTVVTVAGSDRHNSRSPPADRSHSPPVRFAWRAFLSDEAHGLRQHHVVVESDVYDARGCRADVLDLFALWALPRRYEFVSGPDALYRVLAAVMMDIQGDVAPAVAREF